MSWSGQNETTPSSPGIWWIGGEGGRGEWGEEGGREEDGGRVRERERERERERWRIEG